MVFSTRKGFEMDQDIDKPVGYMSPKEHHILTVKGSSALITPLGANGDVPAYLHPSELTWMSTKTQQPVASDPHYPVSVLGVIDDPSLRMNGDDPFVDIVAYWPALDKWTVTHTNRADDCAVDYKVNVTFWQPKPAIPKCV